MSTPGWPPGPEQGPYPQGPYPQSPYPQSPYPNAAYPQAAYPRPKPVDGVSVAALVTGVLLIWPAALICGLVGIRRTRESSPQQGRGFAIAGLVLGILEALGTAVLVVALIAVANSSLGRNAVALARGERAFTGDLQRGDCFDAPTNLTYGPFSTVRKQDCARAHEAEVIEATTSSTDGSYPGAEELRTAAGPKCTEALAAVRSEHPDVPRLLLVELAPTRSAWGQGDGSVICTVLRINGSLTGRLTDFPSEVSGTTT